MKVIEIAFSAYPVTDVKRAKQFYEGILGLTVSRTFDDGKATWIEYDIGPSTLCITNMASEWKPNPGGGGVALEVEDFDAAVDQLKANGVPIAMGPADTPMCHLVVVSDPDGNSVTIHKRKST